jgi:hypothetical protein
MANGGGDPNNLGKSLGIAAQMGMLPGSGNNGSSSGMRQQSGSGLGSIPGAGLVNRAANTAGSVGNHMLNRAPSRAMSAGHW